MEKPSNYDALIAFAQGEAYCPCCQGINECDPECTIEEDLDDLHGISQTYAKERLQRMLRARNALKGVVQ